MQRIFITGCAKSGTTLLQQLFYSFEDTAIIPNERRLSEFFEDRIKDLILGKKIVVMKRKSRSILSNFVRSRKLEISIEIILEHDIKIVNIFRDGRDVSYEQNPYIYGRWIRSIEMMQTLQRFITLNIKYEDLIKSPDRTQKKIADGLGLIIKYKFSEYPNFVPEEEFKIDGEKSYKRRPIMTDRIGKNLDEYKRICPPELVQKFEEKLKWLGYIT